MNHDKPLAGAETFGLLIGDSGTMRIYTSFALIKHAPGRYESASRPLVLGSNGRPLVLAYRCNQRGFCLTQPLLSQTSRILILDGKRFRLRTIIADSPASSHNAKFGVILAKYAKQEWAWANQN